MMVALMAAITVQAQDAPRHHHGGGRGHGMDPAKMVEMQVNRLNEALSLTADQKAAITTILNKDMETHKADFKKMEEKKREEMKAAQEQKQARHERMKARQDAINAEIESVLTADQKAKFAEMKKQGPKHGPRHGKKGDMKADKNCDKKGDMKCNKKDKACGSACCEKDQKK